MIKKLTGFAVVNSDVGKKIAYSYSEIDDKGMIVSSNKRNSFVVLNENIKEAISLIEGEINKHLNE